MSRQGRSSLELRGDVRRGCLDVRGIDAEVVELVRLVGEHVMGGCDGPDDIVRQLGVEEIQELDAVLQRVEVLLDELDRRLRLSAAPDALLERLVELAELGRAAQASRGACRAGPARCGAAGPGRGKSWATASAIAWSSRSMRVLEIALRRTCRCVARAWTPTSSSPAGKIVARRNVAIFLEEVTYASVANGGDLTAALGLHADLAAAEQARDTGLYHVRGVAVGRAAEVGEERRPAEARPRIRCAPGCGVRPRRCTRRRSVRSRVRGCRARR